MSRDAPSRRGPRAARPDPVKATIVTILLAAAALALVLAILVRAVLVALIAYAPPATLDVSVERSADLPAAGDELAILTWNVGFAGLGRDADFLPDGGKSWRPRSRAAVDRNLGAITERLRAERADVVLLQELSRASLLTHGADVLSDVRAALPERAFSFTPTIRIARLPVVGTLEVGKATSSRFAVASAVRHALPSERLPAGVRLQHFNLLESRLPAGGGAGSWAIINVHLAAFDDGALRRAQLDELKRLAESAYRAGHFVVAGGDYNLRLARTEFPHTSKEKATFWVRDLPADFGMPGWRWAVDASAPTCRTLERPYRRGENYTCVIDGFLVSPNVEVLEVETLDLGFEHSDHNPVRLRVRARREAPAP